MGEWLLSRRDGAIVAWHEVPGTSPTQKSRPPFDALALAQAGRRVRSDSCRYKHLDSVASLRESAFKHVRD
jgi:hypothetical protein